MSLAVTTRVTAAVLVAAGLAGCMGGGSKSSEPATQTVRATIVTAPADLQLLCASEAATRFGSDPSGVLPTSSAQIESARYQVELTLSPGTATCVVDDNGTIISLVKA